MPIRPNYSIDPGILASVAFASGRGDLQKQRDEMRMRQLQLLEQQRQFNLGLANQRWNRLQGQNFDLYRMQQGAQLESRLAQQRALQQAALQKQRFGQDLQLQREDNAARYRFDAMASEMDAMRAATEKRAEVERTLSGYGPDGSRLFDPSMLNAHGAKQYEMLQKDLQDLNRVYQAGRISPQTYTQQLIDLQGRASMLASPHMQQPPPKPIRDQIRERMYYDEEVGAWMSIDRNGLPKVIEGAKPPGESSQQQMVKETPAGFMMIGPDGKVAETIPKTKIFENIRSFAKDLMSNGVAPWMAGSKEVPTGEVDENGKPKTELVSTPPRTTYEEWERYQYEKELAAMRGEPLPAAPWETAGAGGATGAAEEQPRPLPFDAQEPELSETYTPPQPIIFENEPQRLAAIDEFAHLQQRYKEGKVTLAEMERLAQLRMSLPQYGKPLEPKDLQLPPARTREDIAHYRDMIRQIKERYVGSGAMAPYEAQAMMVALLQAIAASPAGRAAITFHESRPPKPKQQKRTAPPPMPKPQPVPTEPEPQRKGFQHAPVMGRGMF